MIQRLACLSISDPAYLDGFLEAHGDLADVAAGFSSGGWGLGLWRAGEMLTRKTPVNASFDGLSVLRTSQARQCVLVADANAALRSSRATMQPLRFRDWVFGVTGTVADVDAFTERARRELAGFGKAGPTLPDLVMTTMMHALYRANVLDRRPLSTTAYHTAMTRGLERLREFAGGDDDVLSLAFVMHVEGSLLLGSAGRPLRVHRCSAPGRRSRRRPLWSATVVTDAGDGGEVFEWSGLEIDSHGETRPFQIV